MVEVKNPAEVFVAEYTYDALGRRVEKMAAVLQSAITMTAGECFMRPMKVITASVIMYKRKK